MNKRNYSVMCISMLGLVVVAAWTGRVTGKMQGSTPWAIWCTAGSAGSVQTYSDGKIKQSGERLVFKGSKTGSAFVQYSVIPTDGFYWQVQMPVTTDFVVRYKDNGSFSQVKLNLIAVNINNGNKTTVYKFDSDDYGTSNNPITRTFSFTLDKPWGDFVYYIAGTMKRTALEGEPEIIAIQIKAYDD
ncbi:MAG: hypothetical protein O7G85_12180 [Planctomycetota bacterium]|nr:hypothetical protein [Planctomycetota bacterium]